MNAREEFRAAMAQRQIVPPQEIIADGKIHRCHAEGKGGRGDAAYLLHEDGIAAGGFENHRDGQGWQNWRANDGDQLVVAPRDRLTDELRALIRSRKHELLDALSPAPDPFADFAREFARGTLQQCQACRHFAHSIPPGGDNLGAAWAGWCTQYSQAMDPLMPFWCDGYSPTRSAT